jgi:hypothetical protein
VVAVPVSVVAVPVSVVLEEVVDDDVVAVVSPPTSLSHAITASVSPRREIVFTLVIWKPLLGVYPVTFKE